MSQNPTIALDLDGRVGSVRAARSEVERFLRDLDSTGGPRYRQATCRDIVLIVSELVANACRHAPGPCALVVSASREGVEVSVEDTSRALLRAPPPGGPGGYGLLVVARLSEAVHVVRTARGKIVQAVVAERPSGRSPGWRNPSYPGASL
ncbi:ATP-binding protein [Kitasatospora sp. McL0602]|uniref:ATP-binding protein n=1 Tax=Kitasatospora sp. McL0602 TaxID=3439530 RepID=UPI003F88ECA7